MGKTVDVIKSKIDPSELITWAVKLPTVRVGREKYLRAQFDQYCSPEPLEKVIAVGPGAAGIPNKTISLISKSAITQETARVSLISAAAGIPGGWAMAATIPADLAQYTGAMIRISQKLAYIHDWPELFESEDALDDETKNRLLVFLGAMYGINGANKGPDKIAVHFSQVALKKIPAASLTKGAIYPLVKKISLALGVSMTKTVFASGVSKAVPVVGGVISGAISYVTFRKMANRLNTHLTLRKATKKRANRKKISPAS